MAVILPSVYKDGTATVNNGGTTVTGQNTLFMNSVLPGDFFGSSQGVWVRIASVDSNTTLTLAHEWPEASQTASAYEIMLQSDNARMQETSRQLLETLSSGNNYSLGQLNGSVDQIPIFSAPGVFTLVSKSELLSGDVKGPAAASGLLNKIATFADNTGKLIKAATPEQAGVPIAGYISSGANISNNATDIVNDLNYPACTVASQNTPRIVMTMEAGVGQLDVAFGTGNGARLDAAIADGTWHCYVISAADGVGRFAMSQSLTPWAAPNWPAGFAYFRRIGSWIRTAGALERILQNEDEFIFVTNKQILLTNDALSNTLITIPTPLGISVDVALNSSMRSTATGSNVQTFVGTPGIGAVAINVASVPQQINLQNVFWQFRTNTSSQINVQININAGAVNLNVLSLIGWRDRRGR